MPLEDVDPRLYMPEDASEGYMQLGDVAIIAGNQRFPAHREVKHSKGKLGLRVNVPESECPKNFLFSPCRFW